MNFQKRSFMKIISHRMLFQDVFAYPSEMASKTVENFQNGL